jgi:tail protein X
LINSSSRYASSTIITTTYEGGDIAVIVPAPQGEYAFNFIWYQITALDRLDLLSYRFLGDATQWWQIADANPEVMKWDTVPVGTIIRIPVLGLVL